MAQVFKRALDEVYRLKIQAARKVFGQINRNSPTMPFTVCPGLPACSSCKKAVARMVHHTDPSMVTDQSACAQMSALRG